MEERISSAEAAKLIGIKTQTLAKWRWQGRGPRGWVQGLEAEIPISSACRQAFLVLPGAAAGRDGLCIRRCVRKALSDGEDSTDVRTREQVREPADHR